MVPVRVDLGTLHWHMARMGEVLSDPDMTEELAAWMRDVKEIHQDAMLSGMSPSGVPHAPLKNPRPSGNTGPPLVDFGDLFADLVNLQTAEPLSATFGTEHEKNGVPVADIHQFGTSTIPARPHTELTDEMIDMVLNRVADKLADLIVER